MTAAKTGDKVKVHYTGKTTEGQVFDSSRGRDPLEFTIGTGQLIPGFEQAVVGMQAGENKTETIAAEKAYGPRMQELVIDVGRDKLPPDLKPEVGQRLALTDPQGRNFPVVVAAVADDTVKLDGNHPLSGQNLVFEIETK